MSSRALSLATVLLLIGLLAAGRVQAQENLDAGKTPSQIFAGTCNACHKSPRGLLKTVSPSSLPSFLRQHYTTSPNMAGVLSSYLVSNGATDTRLPSAKETKPAAKQEAKQEPRPNGPPEQLDRWGRRLHPNGPPPPQEAAAPAATPAAEPKPEAEPPAQAATDRPDGRKNAAKQKLTKRGKPGEELPKEEPAAASEAPESESAAREEGRPEANRPETVKPADDGHSQSAKVEQPADSSAVRPDPVPPVTPAPSTTATATAPTAPAPAQAAVALPPTEMAVPLPATATAPPPQSPAVTASTAPPLPPVAPAGLPAPPISR
jgi:hypothetical protein